MKWSYLKYIHIYCEYLMGWGSKYVFAENQTNEKSVFCFFCSQQLTFGVTVKTFKGGGHSSLGGSKLVSYKRLMLKSIS